MFNTTNRIKYNKIQENKMENQIIESLDEDEKKIKQNGEKISLNSSVWLNVGGQFFCTRISTLVSKSKYFQALFESEFDENENGKTQQTAIFIDRDPHLFKYILSYLRDSRYLCCSSIPNYHINIRQEFDYYNISTPIRFYIEIIVSEHWRSESIDFHFYAIPPSIAKLIQSKLLIHSRVRDRDRFEFQSKYCCQQSKYDYLLPSIAFHCVNLTYSLQRHRLKSLASDATIPETASYFKFMEELSNDSLLVFEQQDIEEKINN
jgi:hypothetical protein